MYKAIEKLRSAELLTATVSSPHENHQLFTPEEKEYAKLTKCNLM